MNKKTMATMMITWAMRKWIAALVAVFSLAVLSGSHAASENEYRITWYGERLAGNPLGCGSDIYGSFDPSDITTAATPWRRHQCGDRLLVCTDVNCLVVVVKDRCGECGRQHIDLSRGAWKALGGRDYATVTNISTAPAQTQSAPITAPSTGTGGFK
jgi:hypothetical protein